MHIYTSFLLKIFMKCFIKKNLFQLTDTAIIQHTNKKLQCMFPQHSGSTSTTNWHIPDGETTFTEYLFPGRGLSESNMALI